MATIASKRELNTKSINDKYSALKTVEDGKTKSQVAGKYDIPKNILSTWLKNKDKFSNPRRKEATQNASDGGRALLQTWIKQCLNGSWLFEAEMELFWL